MANIPEFEQWDEGIYQLEESDEVHGGPDGIDNRQAKALANRTCYLRKKMELTRGDLTAHVADADPHPQYVTAAEGDAQYAKKTDSYSKPDIDATFATIASPEFSISAKGPTPPVGDNSTNLATTEWIQHLLKSQDCYDLSSRFDFSTAISAGTANTLYSPTITRPKGVYLVTPYVLGWGFSNTGGSYYMQTVANFVDGTGNSGFVNFEQTVKTHYNRSAFVVRITSPNASFRFALTNSGNALTGQGTVAINPAINGLNFYATRIG